MFHRLSVIAVVAGLLFLTGCSGESETTPQADTANYTETIVLSVDGMTCEGCASSIKDTVAKLPSVGEITVSVEEKKATVKVAKADEATKNTVADAIAKLGFTVAAQ